MNSMDKKRKILRPNRCRTNQLPGNTATTSYEKVIQQVQKTIRRSCKGPTIVEDSSSESSDLEEAFPRITNCPTYGSLETQSKSTRGRAVSRNRPGGGNTSRLSSTSTSGSVTTRSTSVKPRQPPKESPSKGKVGSWSMVWKPCQNTQSQMTCKKLDFPKCGNPVGVSPHSSPPQKSPETIASVQQDMILLSSDSEDKPASSGPHFNGSNEFSSDSDCFAALPKQLPVHNHFYNPKNQSENPSSPVVQSNDCREFSSGSTDFVANSPQAVNRHPNYFQTSGKRKKTGHISFNRKSDDDSSDSTDFVVTSPRTHPKYILTSVKRKKKDRKSFIRQSADDSSDSDDFVANSPQTVTRRPNNLLKSRGHRVFSEISTDNDQSDTKACRQSDPKRVANGNGLDIPLRSLQSTFGSETSTDSDWLTISSHKPERPLYHNLHTYTRHSSTSLLDKGRSSTFVHDKGHLSMSIHDKHKGHLSTSVHDRGHLSTSIHDKGHSSSFVNYDKEYLSTSKHGKGNLSSSVHDKGNSSSPVHDKRHLSTSVHDKGHLSTSIHDKGHSSTSVHDSTRSCTVESHFTKMSVVSNSERDGKTSLVVGQSDVLFDSDELMDENDDFILATLDSMDVETDVGVPQATTLRSDDQEPRQSEKSLSVGGIASRDHSSNCEQQWNLPETTREPNTPAILIRTQSDSSSDDEPITKYFTQKYNSSIGLSAEKSPTSKVSVQELIPGGATGQKSNTTAVISMTGITARNMDQLKQAATSVSAGNEIISGKKQVGELIEDDSVLRKTLSSPTADQEKEENALEIMPQTSSQNFTETDDVIVLWDSDDDDEAFLNLTQSVVNIKEENDSDLDATEVSEVDILGEWEPDLIPKTNLFENEGNVESPCENLNFLEEPDTSSFPSSRKSFQLIDGQVEESTLPLTEDYSARSPSPTTCDSSLPQVTASKRTSVFRNRSPISTADQPYITETHTASQQISTETHAVDQPTSTETPAIIRQTSTESPAVDPPEGAVPAVGHPGDSDSLGPSSKKSSPTSTEKTKVIFDDPLPSEVLSQLLDDSMELEPEYVSDKCERDVPPSKGRTEQSSPPSVEQDINTELCGTDLHKNNTLPHMASSNVDLSSQTTPVNPANIITLDSSSDSLTDNMLTQLMNESMELDSQDLPDGHIELCSELQPAAMENDALPETFDRDSKRTPKKQVEVGSAINSNKLEGVASTMTVNFDETMDDEDLASFLSNQYCQTTPTKSKSPVIDLSRGKDVQSSGVSARSERGQNFTAVQVLQQSSRVQRNDCQGFKVSSTSSKLSLNEDIVRAPPASKLGSEDMGASSSSSLSDLWEDRGRKVALKGSSRISRTDQRLSEKRNRSYGKEVDKLCSVTHTKDLKKRSPDKERQHFRDHSQTRKSVTCSTKEPPHTLPPDKIKRNSQDRTSSGTFVTNLPRSKSDKGDSRASTANRKSRAVSTCQMEVHAAQKIKAGKKAKAKGSLAVEDQISLTQSINNARKSMIERRSQVRKARLLGTVADKKKSASTEVTKRVSEAKKKKITGMSVPGTGQSEAQQTRQHGDVNTVPVGGSRQISKPAETSMSAGLNSTEKLDLILKDVESRKSAVQPPCSTKTPEQTSQEINTFLSKIKQAISAPQPRAPAPLVRTTRVNLPIAKPSCTAGIFPVQGPPSGNRGKRDSVEDFKTAVLYWQPAWLREMEVIPGLPSICRGAVKAGMLPSPTLWPIPTYFESAKEYVEILLVHLLHETWASVFSDWKKSRQRHHSLLLVKLLDKDKTFVRYCYQGLINKQDQQPVSEDDLVIIRPGSEADRNKQDKWVMGLVSKVTKSQPRNRFDLHEKLGSLESARKKNQLVLNVFIQVSALKTQPSLNVEFKGIEVVSSLTSVLRQVTGLGGVSRSLLSRDLLNPVNNYVFTQPTCTVGKELLKTYNGSQAQAIQAVTKMLLQPYSAHQVALIQGPPGTGKSHTIVGIIKTVVRQKTAEGRRPCLLLCAPSNAAVDEIVRRLDRENRESQKNGSGRSINLVRIGMKNSIHPSIRQYSLDAKAEACWLEEVLRGKLAMMPSSVRKDYTDTKAQVQRLSEEREMARLSRHQDKVRSIEGEMGRLEKKISKIMGVSKAEVMRREDRQRMEHVVIGRSDVVCCTLNAAGSRYMQAAVNYVQPNTGGPSHRFQFTAVIIDEACQSVEVEALIPLQYGCTKMALIGDPHQLPPTVISQEAAEMNYSQSMFERLYNAFRSKGHKFVHMLDTQYRMHPSIAAFPSKYVYDGRLKTDPMVSAEREHFPFPNYRLFDLLYSREQAGTGSSVSNQEEVAFIVSLLRHLTMTRVRQDVIGIITPYQQQKALMLSRLQQNNMGGVTVGTVDGFQGQEKDVIVMSCVRANSHSGKIGFVADRRRMNVGLTRAKYACYVVGHLESLMVDSNWKALVTDAIERKVIYKVRSQNMTEEVIWSACKKP